MRKLGNCLTMVHSLRNALYHVERIAVSESFTNPWLDFTGPGQHPVTPFANP
jgi:hypothetical protein